MTDKTMYCVLSPPPPHSEAASGSQQPHSTLGSTEFALHRSDHVTASVSMDTAPLERTRKRNNNKKCIICESKEKFWKKGTVFK